MTKEISKKEDAIVRPPIVAVMGHIDHGKSTLLDTIRKSRITAKEAGGITQHIGAYEIKHGENRISFLDTPGHEAFVSVRDRGAQIADIAILIVSAEDGVKPQTLEALNSIKKAEVPFIVAINKVDSPKANVDLAKASLIENEIYLEGMGGDISFAEISAKEGTGIDELLDLVLLTAEIEDFKAESNGEGYGLVIESNKCKKKGISGTLVLRNGTLKVGNFVATETSFSPVRSIESSEGENLKEVTFSTPFIICGFSELPDAGDTFKVFDNKKDAEAFSKTKVKELVTKHKDFIVEKDSTVIPLIIKTDVAGSKEAIEYELNKAEVEGITFKVLESGTGDISEKDAKLAMGNEKTLVIGFNVGVDSQAKQIIDRNETTVKVFNIIYEAIQWIVDSAKERKDKIVKEEEIGKVKILKIFGNNKKLQIIGGKVKEGKIETGARFKLLRRNEPIDKGVVKGLQKVKDQVTLVTGEEEFGGAIDCRTDVAEGDMLYLFNMVEK